MPKIAVNINNRRDYETFLNIIQYDLPSGVYDDIKLKTPFRPTLTLTVSFRDGSSEPILDFYPNSQQLHSVVHVDIDGFRRWYTNNEKSNNIVDVRDVQSPPKKSGIKLAFLYLKTNEPDPKYRNIEFVSSDGNYIWGYDADDYSNPLNPKLKKFRKDRIVDTLKWTMV